MGFFSNLLNMGASAPKDPIPENALLIDVRSAGEFSSGHIEGSINMPLGSEHVLIQKVCPDKSKHIVVFCASGMRSSSAKKTLSNLGYDNVINGGGIGSLSIQLNKSIIR